jgi:hypothetical protein
MSQVKHCEYCGRTIKSDPVKKTRRGKEHVFCSEFCFRLDFYSVPTITYDDLQKMYKMYCVSLPAKDFQKTLRELNMGEG